MPKYMQIADEIERQIQTLNLPQGTKLSNIQELTQTYQVSKNTILKTLKQLEDRGVIYQVQGSGIFVRRKKRKGYISLIQNQGFSSDFEDDSEKARLLNFGTLSANEHLASQLQCPVGTPLYEVERLHFFRGQIYCYEHSYFNQEVVSFLNQSIAETSIFEYLNQALHIQVGFSDKYLNIQSPSSEIANHLNLKKTDSVLKIEEVYYSSSGKAFDYSKNYYHPDHAQFFIQS